ncbi:sensor domain-containing diguanylate cyclase [Pseudoalteromonas pernae]|uniref:sensor domain-containing diguanylate cyclase n=1 Tax=Pseudoalteromonas pernae TaxID=3118054 RepID=UPI003241DBA7
MKTSSNTDNSFLKKLSVDELLQVVPDLFFALNADGTILEHQAGNSSDLYVPPQEFLGKSMFDVLPPEPAQLLRITFERVKFSGQLNSVHYQLNVGGDFKWFEARIVKSKEDRFIMLVRDITVDKTKELSILHQIHHDHLTGLYNRCYAFEFIQRELHQAHNGLSELALFYIDIDDFKDINDQLGHVIGDEVLKEVAHAIQKSVRKDDIACRIGGDEFLVIANGEFTHTTLRSTAKHILRAIEAASRKLALGLNFSVSIGISISSPNNTDPMGLVEQADSAMYDAKHCGKHGYAIFTAPT